MATENELNCLTCGACCSHFCDDDEVQDLGFKGQGIYVGNVDVSQLPKKLVIIDRYPESGSHDAWLKGKKVDGVWRCAALKGGIGKQVSCKVYDRRPETCRNFEKGSDLCLEIRRKFGIES